MSTVSQATAPVIGMLKSIVTFMVVMVIAYAGSLIVLKAKIPDRRRFVLYKQLLGLAVLLVMAAFVFWRVTHR